MSHDLKPQRLIRSNITKTHSDQNAKQVAEEVKKEHLNYLLIKNEMLISIVPEAKDDDGNDIDFKKQLKSLYKETDQSVSFSVFCQMMKFRNIALLYAKGQSRWAVSSYFTGNRRKDDYAKDLSLLDEAIELLECKRRKKAEEENEEENETPKKKEDNPSNISEEQIMKLFYAVNKKLKEIGYLDRYSHIEKQEQYAIIGVTSRTVKAWDYANFATRNHYQSVQNEYQKKLKALPGTKKDKVCLEKFFDHLNENNIAADWDKWRLKKHILQCIIPAAKIGLKELKQSFYVDNKGNKHNYFVNGLYEEILKRPFLYSAEDPEESILYLGVEVASLHSKLNHLRSEARFSFETPDDICKYMTICGDNYHNFTMSAIGEDVEDIEVEVYDYNHSKKYETMRFINGKRTTDLSLNFKGIPVRLCLEGKRNNSYFADAIVWELDNKDKTGYLIEYGKSNNRLYMLVKEPLIGCRRKFGKDVLFVSLSGTLVNKYIEDDIVSARYLMQTAAPIFKTSRAKKQDKIGDKWFEHCQGSTIKIAGIDIGINPIAAITVANVTFDRALGNKIKNQKQIVIDCYAEDYKIDPVVVKRMEDIRHIKYTINSWYHLADCCRLKAANKEYVVNERKQGFFRENIEYLKEVAKKAITESDQQIKEQKAALKRFDGEKKKEIQATINGFNLKIKILKKFVRQSAKKIFDSTLETLEKYDNNIEQAKRDREFGLKIIYDLIIKYYKRSKKEREMNQRIYVDDYNQEEIDTERTKKIRKETITFCDNDWNSLTKRIHDLEKKMKKIGISEPGRVEQEINDRDYYNNIQDNTKKRQAKIIVDALKEEGVSIIVVEDLTGGGSENTKEINKSFDAFAPIRFLNALKNCAETNGIQVTEVLSPMSSKMVPSTGEIGHRDKRDKQLYYKDGEELKSIDGDISASEILLRRGVSRHTELIGTMNVEDVLDKNNNKNKCIKGYVCNRWGNIQNFEKILKEKGIGEREIIYLHGDKILTMDEKRTLQASIRKELKEMRERESGEENAGTARKKSKPKKKKKIKRNNDQDLSNNRPAAS